MKLERKNLAFVIMNLIACLPVLRLNLVLWRILGNTPKILPFFTYRIKILKLLREIYSKVILRVVF